MMGLLLTAPLALIGLIALPLIWWLLRVQPPAPKRQTFPPLALLTKLKPVEETPASTPWWVMLLRLSLVALAILALAGPELHPNQSVLSGKGPLSLIVDNGWSSAQDWPARVALAEKALDEAERLGITVALLATAEPANQEAALTTATTARSKLKALSPRSWLPPREGALPRLKSITATAPTDVLWIAEPVDDGTAPAFIKGLKELSPNATLKIAGLASPAPLLLTDVRNEGAALSVTLAQIDPASPGTGTLRTLDQRGATLSETPFTFAANQTTAKIPLTMPVELRNDVARVEVAGSHSAASLHLLDDRWRRKKVGIFSTQTSEQAEALLTSTYYLQKALAPFADVELATQSETAAGLTQLIQNGASMIILADIGKLSPQAEAQVTEFMTKGGVLLRFAGPRLSMGDDGLVPVPLRKGERALGGALSWATPQRLTDFPENSPFAGVPVPLDVTITRQVLAAPSPDLEQRTWARLVDGTPLVTARAQGAGRLVLVHVTADTSWSNLPISGLFVDMLQRIVSYSNVMTTKDNGTSTTTLPLLSLLTGDGHLVSPTSVFHGLALQKLSSIQPSSETPPGLYGTTSAFRALNPLRADANLHRIDPALVADLAQLPLSDTESITALAPWAFLLALLLLVVDTLASLFLSGKAPKLAIFALLILAASALTPEDGRAADFSTIPQKTIAASLTTHLAYVETGNKEVDETSRLGLTALGNVIAARTSLEPGAPIAVDPETDDLPVYPLIYWPMDANSPLPSAAAMSRIDAYMRTGGTVLFDTRDQLGPTPGAGPTPETARLREMLSTLDIPPLEPVPSNHVLTKAFYLLSNFPGRYDGSPLWAVSNTNADPRSEAARVVSAGDGVSPLLITGNDFAGAWASDENGTFLYPLVPGDDTQREMAFRVGVNIVMYTLTGSYKADQVHIPAILERLGK